MSDNAEHVRLLARAADPDRYLSALYAPAKSRRSLFALYAFNAEIAALRDRIREPMAGEIRLQWWRDALENPKAGAGNPLFAELVLAIEAHQLPRAAFDRYLAAREFDLYDDPMPSRTDLEGYAGETASTVLLLAAMVLDRSATTSASDAAGHAGCTQAIAGVLRLTPRHRSRSQCYVPLDILAAAGCSVEEWIAGDDAGPCRRVAAAMIALADEHLTAFRATLEATMPSIRAAFFPAMLAPAFLDRLRSWSATSGEAVPELAVWRRQWLMFRAATRNRW